MNDLRRVYGFNVHRRYRFRLGNRKYRLGFVGVRTLSLLAHVAAARPEKPSLYWLLPLRAWCREIRRLGDTAALTFVADHTDSDALRTLAIWLRGRCGGRLGAPTLARFSKAKDRTLRKETIRCLKRISAWAQLRVVEECEIDPKIRAIARQSPPRAFPSRLTQFTSNLESKDVRRRRAKLIVASGTEPWRGRAPRTGPFIRAVLKRLARR